MVAFLTGWQLIRRQNIPENAPDKGSNARARTHPSLFELWTLLKLLLGAEAQPFVEQAQFIISYIAAH